ncbi:glycosyltransferase [Phycicoccus duodecadis]|uniref:Glycosyltransferase involved in cell wall biosynthesis n=1 Tax=Phycicoccus duodecadis TaxID=173053 RepID=A0A2N3YIN5_9MICO|nr:glycosyltransferase [Phycicoccus duodecadis]PKW26716.1 glycosyltransferase involved in cell wall biosynthesis [Phycicoccus duodecadis]
MSTSSGHRVPPGPDAGDRAPLRVLVVAPKGFVGGAEAWLLSILGAAGRRLSVDAVVLDDGPLVEELASRGARVTVRPTGPRPLDLLSAGGSLRTVLRRADPDVVLANGIKAAVAVGPVAWAAGVPLVWVRHDPSFDPTLGRVVHRLATRTVTVTPRGGADVEHPGALVVAPPLLAEPLPRAEALERLHALGVPDGDHLLLGMTTRLAPYKGLDTAIRALARPGATRWRLVVAGVDDPGAPGEQARLAALAREAGVEDRVTWLGSVDGAGRLAAGFDAVALLTRAGVPGYPSAEGHPLVMIEALAAGTPVVTDPRTVPPARDAATARGCALVDATDPVDVAAALHRLAETDARAAVAAEAGAVGAVHPRAPEVADTIVTVLREAATRPGAGEADGPAVTVVTTVLNEATGVDELLELLVPQLRHDDRLVVVDGGSTDGTWERLQEWESREPRVEASSAPGAGISAGRNIGIRRARTAWVACTDVGCRPEPGWLDGFRRAAGTGRYDLVTGVYRAGDDGSDWSRALAAVAYPRPAEQRRRTPLVRTYGRFLGRAYDARLCTGRSVAFTRDAAEAAGGFPEHLATAEDVRFGMAAVDAGARPVLSLDAEVTWAQRPTLAANGRMFRGYGRGDGLSGDRVLVGRNLARALVFASLPVLALHPTGRRLAVSGLATYLSLPLARAARGPRPLPTMVLVPAVAAYRDLMKARGCAEGLLQRRRERTRA